MQVWGKSSELQKSVLWKQQRTFKFSEDLPQSNFKEVLVKFNHGPRLASTGEHSTAFLACKANLSQIESSILDSFDRTSYSNLTTQQSIL
jgi:hypothetical protein